MHEFSFLFLQEFYKKRPTCDIFTLDPSAVLNVLSKAQCFPDKVKDQASKTRDDIRNPWAHAVIEEWTDIKMDEAFTEMEKLAKMVDNNGELVRKLEMDKNGRKKTDFQMKQQLLLIDKYRNCVKKGVQTRV